MGQGVLWVDVDTNTAFDAINNIPLAIDKSGNPGGRPRSLASVMHAARRHTLPALKTLVDMKNAKSESVRLGAAEAILSRGWGRPIQAFQIDGRFLTKKLSDMTPDEIKGLNAKPSNAPQEQSR